jgi:hypothetical protein
MPLLPLILLCLSTRSGIPKVGHLTHSPDAEFEGELGYSLIKALRGKTVGRRLKRNLFKFGYVCVYVCVCM